jgi:hypothetical protein
MARKKPEKTYQYWVDKILVSLKDDIIIWQFDKSTPVPGVVMGDPISIEGASPTWKLTLVCIPEFGSPAQLMAQQKRTVPEQWCNSIRNW